MGCPGVSPRSSLVPIDAQKLVLLYLKRADLQPPLGHPGGSCYFQKRIRERVKNDKVQDFLVNKHQDGPKVDWKDMEEDAIYRKDMDIGPVGQTLVEVLLVPHTQRRMDIRSITVREIKSALYEFMDEIHKEKRSGDSRLEKQLLSRKDFEWKGSKVKFWLRGLSHWTGDSKKGKPQLKVKLQVRTVMPAPFKHPNPVPETECPHFSGDEWEGWSKEYPEHGFERMFPKRAGDTTNAGMLAALDNMEREVDKWRGLKGVSYFRRDPYDLALAGRDFIVAGRKWMEQVIDSLAIPARKAKGTEMLARLFNRSTVPKDLVKWFDQNAKRWPLLRESTRWEARGEGDDGAFKVGPFTVHNTVGASGKQLEKIRRVIEKAIKKGRKGTGLPGFGRTMTGDIYVVGQLQRPKWAAWYMPSKDVIYLRANMRGISEEATVQHLIHELGHRYKAKMMDKPLWGRWQHHHRSLSQSNPSVTMPSAGDTLPFTVNSKDVVVGEEGPQGILLNDLKTGDPVGTVARLTMFKWLKGMAKKKSFPSLYSASDAEEHFSEALSMRALGTLPAVHQTSFDALVAGEEAGSVRVALRYAVLRQDPIPGVQTYVTQRSQEGLPNDVDDGSPTALPLPGSATPGGAGRVIPQFSFNVPGPGSEITPRTLGVPGEQYGHPSNDTYNNVTRRIIESAEDAASLDAASLCDESVDGDPLDEEAMDKQAYRPKWRPGKYQRKSRGRTKHKRQMNYRKNKAKNKMKAKRWRKINSRKPAYKQWQKKRRSMNRKRRVASSHRVLTAYLGRRGSVLTVPDIAFQIGPEMIGGYVHSISPMSGMVTIELNSTNVSQLDSIPVELFMRMAVFSSDEDIDAFFDLVDVEVGPEAYGDLDPNMVRECARRYDRDPDAGSFKEDCFGISGEYDLGSMDAGQMDSVVRMVSQGYTQSGIARDLTMGLDRDSRSQEDADDPEISDAYDPHLYYGEVEVG